MSLIARYERAVSLPWWRRSGALVAACSVSYFAFAAVLALYLLPTGFGVEGTTLLPSRLAVAVLGAGMIGYAAVMIRRQVGRRAALWAVADACGWGYVAQVSDRPWGGSIDEQVSRNARTTLDYLDARQTPLPFDAAYRSFTVGEGEGATVNTTLAVRIPLPSEAPRIQLRSRTGAGPLSVLPLAPRGRRRLTLEGDFSDVFEVSVPEGYEPDALYVLTPDLMAILLDNASDLDLEVVDSTLHVSFAPLDLSLAEERGRVLTVVAALYERFGRRTLLYRDEAAPPLDAGTYRRSGDSLSAAARRLDTRLRVGPVVAAVLVPFVPLLLGIAFLALTR